MKILLIINTILLALLVLGPWLCPAMKKAYCPTKSQMMCPYVKGSGSMDMKGSMDMQGSMPQQDSGMTQQ
jgi:hypothetical protein